MPVSWSAAALEGACSSCDEQVFRERRKGSAGETLLVHFWQFFSDQELIGDPRMLISPILYLCFHEEVDLFKVLLDIR